MGFCNLLLGEGRCCVGLLVVGDVHGFNKGRGDESGLDGSVPSERLRQEDTRQSDCISGLHSSCKVAPQLY